MTRCWFLKVLLNCFLFLGSFNQWHPAVKAKSAISICVSLLEELQLEYQPMRATYWELLTNQNPSFCQTFLDFFTLVSDHSHSVTDWYESEEKWRFPKCGQHNMYIHTSIVIIIIIPSSIHMSLCFQTTQQLKLEMIYGWFTEK